jgi:hypothetical protein
MSVLRTRLRLIPAGSQRLMWPVTLPIEFMPDALEEIDDLCAIARKLTHAAELGRIACGQADPEVRELIIDDNRLMYRIEDEQIVVLSAERFAPSLH